VYEWYGLYKLGDFLFDSSSYDLKSDDYGRKRLWAWYEYDYSGYHIIGFTWTAAFRISSKSGDYLDFELSASVHVWGPPSFRNVTCTLTEGGDGPWKFKIRDCTYETETLYISYAFLL